MFDLHSTSQRDQPWQRRCKARSAAKAPDAAWHGRPFIAPSDAGASDPPDAETLEFYRLMLAIGSRADASEITGLFDYCWTLDHPDAFEKVWSALRRRMIDSVPLSKVISLGIVGGGTEGVDFAIAVKRLIDQASHDAGSQPKTAVSITLLEGGHCLAPTVADFPADKMRRTLAELGVDVRLSATVVAVDAAGFLLNNGARIAADVKVWAAGVQKLSD